MKTAPVRRNVPTVTDLHPAVYGGLAFSVFWIIAMCWLFFGANGDTGMVLAASTGFGIAVLALPTWLVLLSRRGHTRKSAFLDWAKSDLEIDHGTIEAGKAAVMALSAPAAAVVGVTAIGFIAWLAATGAI